MKQSSGQTLYTCEYCDRWYRKAGYLERHKRSHTEQAIVLFGRNMEWRAIQRKIHTVAKLIQAGHSWEYWQCYEACHDSAMDLIMSDQRLTYRNIRRDAYRKLIPPVPVDSLDTLLDDTGEEEEWHPTVRQFDSPEYALDLRELLLDAAVEYIGQAATVAYSAILGALEPLEYAIDYELVARQVERQSKPIEGHKRGRPRMSKPLEP